PHPPRFRVPLDMIAPLEVRCSTGCPTARVPRRVARCDEPRSAATTSCLVSGGQGIEERPHDGRPGWLSVGSGGAAWRASAGPSFLQACPNPLGTLGSAPVDPSSRRRVPRLDDPGDAEAFAHHPATNPTVLKRLPPAMRFLGAAGGHEADNLLT